MLGYLALRPFWESLTSDRSSLCTPNSSVTFCCFAPFESFQSTYTFIISHCTGALLGVILYIIPILKQCLGFKILMGVLMCFDNLIPPHQGYFSKTKIIIKHWTLKISWTVKMSPNMEKNYMLYVNLAFEKSLSPLCNIKWRPLYKWMVWLVLQYCGEYGGIFFAKNNSVFLELSFFNYYQWNLFSISALGTSLVDWTNFFWIYRQIGRQNVTQIGKSMPPLEGVLLEKELGRILQFSNCIFFCISHSTESPD